MSWIDRLQQRWKVKNAFQVIVILVVFAFTGSTVAYLGPPTLHWFFETEPVPPWAYIIYYILILPVYNLFLLLYGAIFGQFTFFWGFEKRLFKRIFGEKKK